MTLSTTKALNGQAKYPDSPFEIANWSVNEPFPSNWQERVRERIKQVHVVAVICGEYTHQARGVSVEIQIARQEAKPYFLLRGHPDRRCTRPTAAHPSDTMYPWTWDNLVQLLKRR